MALSNSDKFSKEQLIELDRLNQEAVEETNERLERIEKMDIRIDKRIKDSDDAFEEAMREQEERDKTAEEEREENNKLLQLRFLHMVSKFKKDEIHEYMTDLIFLCQKIGRRVFPFGPFGKLY